MAVVDVSFTEILILINNHGRLSASLLQYSNRINLNITKIFYLLIFNSKIKLILILYQTRREECFKIKHTIKSTLNSKGVLVQNWAGKFLKLHFTDFKMILALGQTVSRSFFVHLRDHFELRKNALTRIVLALYPIYIAILLCGIEYDLSLYFFLS